MTHQTGQVLTPTVGPDDRQVALLSDSGGHANVWVVDVESGGLRQVTQERDPETAIGVPVWSPDGSSISFLSTRGNPGLTFGIWLVNPDGSNLRNLANPGLGPAWSARTSLKARTTETPGVRADQRISSELPRFWPWRQSSWARRR